MVIFVGYTSQGSIFYHELHVIYGVMIVKHKSFRLIQI